MPSADIHVVGYFADALAPVWGLNVLDAQVLKRTDGPTSPPLQQDLDRLVAGGLVAVSDVSYREDADGYWRIDAKYSLNPDFSSEVVAATRGLSLLARDRTYVKDVVLALSGLRTEEINEISEADATYADPLVDIGSIVDFSPERGSNLSAQVARRFSELLDKPGQLTAAEMVHLYVRHLNYTVSKARG